MVHGRQDWIDGTLFEIVLRGISLDTYRRALVQRDLGALHGPGLVAAVDRIRRRVGRMDEAFPDRRRKNRST